MLAFPTLPTSYHIFLFAWWIYLWFQSSNIRATRLSIPDISLIIRAATSKKIATTGHTGFGEIIANLGTSEDIHRTESFDT